jgi:hypothetical protein
MVCGVIYKRSKRMMATNSCCAECSVQGELVSRVGSFGTAALVPKEALVVAQKSVQTSCCRATR